MTVSRFQAMNSLHITNPKDFEEALEVAGIEDNDVFTEEQVQQLREVVKGMGQLQPRSRRQLGGAATVGESQRPAPQTPLGQSLMETVETQLDIYDREAQAALDYLNQELQVRAENFLLDMQDIYQDWAGGNSFKSLILDVSSEAIESPTPTPALTGTP